MLTGLLILIVFGGLLTGGVLAMQADRRSQSRSQLACYQLQFPHGIKPEAVTDFLVGLTGLVAPRYLRWLVVRSVVWETVADHSGISHRLLISIQHAETVLAALRAHLPGVRTTALAEVPAVKVSRAKQLGLSHAGRPLAVRSPVAVSSGILAAMQPLEPGERLVLQFAIQPAAPTAAIAPATQLRYRVRSPFLPTSFSITPRQRTQQDVASERAKHAYPLLLATPRIGVLAQPDRAAALLRRMMASFHAANAAGVHFFVRLLPNEIVVRNLTARHVPLVIPPCPLNAAELGMLLGIPLGEVTLPGLRVGQSRLLTPSIDIPRAGRVVAQSTFPGAERPLALSVPDSLQHLHVIGPTGVGKSTLLLGLITQDMAAGRGVVVIDPKGDLAADVLDRVPRGRVGDVVILDLTDTDYPVGLNLLTGAPGTQELLVDQLVGTLHSLWQASWGPRTDDLLRAALLTLVGQPGMTLCEVPLLLSDAAVRRRLVGQVDDPVGLNPFWAWYEALSEAERIQVTGPVFNKLRAFLLRRSLRNVLGQADARLDLADVLAQGRILIVPLRKGILGEEAAALFGSLLIARLWQTVMARAAVAPERRRPVFLYVDEVQDYLHLPTSVADVLAQARGLGVGLTLAHQHLGQLPTALKDAVLANARSRVIFQTSSADAKRLGREVAPYLTPADILGLGPFEVVLSLAVGSRTAPPATGRTVPPPPVTGLAEAASTASRSRYGRPVAEVEAAIRKRHAPGFPAGGVGRLEVSP
jgi:DNA helicase HerA-like ATPase